MKLITKEIEGKLPPLYSQEHNKNPEIIVKFFDAWSQNRWYVIEAEKQEDGDFLFFGLFSNGRDKELCYFLLSELQSLTFKGYPRVERDLYFKGHFLNEVKAGKVA
jgi:hypothetical protein